MWAIISSFPPWTHTQLTSFFDCSHKLEPQMLTDQPLSLLHFFRPFFLLLLISLPSFRNSWATWLWERLCFCPSSQLAPWVYSPHAPMFVSKAGSGPCGYWYFLGHPVFLCTHHERFALLWHSKNFSSEIVVLNWARRKGQLQRVPSGAGTESPWCLL